MFTEQIREIVIHMLYIINNPQFYKYIRKSILDVECKGASGKKKTLQIFSNGRVGMAAVVAASLTMTPRQH